MACLEREVDDGSNDGPVQFYSENFSDVFVSTVRLCFVRLPTQMGLFLLDYGAGNVQSLANTLGRLGHSFKWITSPTDFDDATVSFPCILLRIFTLTRPVHHLPRCGSFPNCCRGPDLAWVS